MKLIERLDDASANIAAVVLAVGNADDLEASPIMALEQFSQQI